MNNHKIRVLFIIALNRIKKNNKAPIYCRITYNKKRKKFSTGLFINPKYWSSSQQLAKPANTQNNIINTQLSLISQKINEAFLMLQVLPDVFDVDDIYRKYKGEDVKTEITILGAYDLHNEKTKKLIGVDFNELSWSRYIESRRKVASFISKFYKKNDVKLKDLDLKFITDLEYYFKTDLNLSHATVYRSLQRVKKIILFAIAENYLQKDPFMLFKNKKYKTEIVYLTGDELNRLENHSFTQDKLQKVKDMFVFCCYTGLAYQEMANLKTENIIINFDGNKWIQIKRQKTQKIISLPLLSKAEFILDKYNNSDNETLLPVISNQKFNSYLKEISEVLGIDKKLTHHIARKTFATTVLLYNDIPMETVSELLGHSNMNITQAHYGKIVNQNISKQMKKLNKKLKK
ncbi:integrase [Gaetbulibacter sp. 5U11]|nr:integrase [Gaetbulibacter sp. 5U11]